MNFIHFFKEIDYYTGINWHKMTDVYFSMQFTTLIESQKLYYGERPNKKDQYMIMNVKH